VSPEELLDTARQAAARAYAPYSRFAVGAGLLTAGGRVVSGCNVENASYGLSNCAERTAVFAMVAGDADERVIDAVAVASPNAAPCFPCGACRQVLHEFGCRHVFVEEDGGVRIHRLADLLPYAFGPDDLQP